MPFDFNTLILLPVIINLITTQISSALPDEGKFTKENISSLIQGLRDLREPANREIQKAARRAYLLALKLICQECVSELQANDLIWLQACERYIEVELESVESDEYATSSLLVAIEQFEAAYTLDLTLINPEMFTKQAAIATQILSELRYINIGDDVVIPLLRETDPPLIFIERINSHWFDYALKFIRNEPQHNEILFRDLTIQLLSNILREQRSGERLQEVLKVITKPSNEAAALHQLPPPPRDFTGRESELEELRAKLKEGGVTISGLRGMGGIGKTTLALKLAAELKSNYPDAQFYLDLKGVSDKPLSVSDALFNVIKACRPEIAKDLSDPSEETLRGIYLSELDGRSALLLMDNAANREQVEPLIPPTSCILLVTSRQHFTLPGMFAINLNTLPPEETYNLLLTIAPRIGDQAEIIAKLCGYLPLALRLAASALAERIDLSVDDYIRRLSEVKQRLKLIEASLSLSYDLLSSELQRNWRALSIIATPFSVATAAAVWGGMRQDLAHDVLSDLVKFSMLEWNEGYYRLHDLVQLYASKCLTGTELSYARSNLNGYYFAALKSGH
jgi:hypothetical protein